MDQRFAAMAQIGGFYDFFASRGISEDQARACLADVPSLEKLAGETDRYAKENQVTGTPTFTLNGDKLDGVNGWSMLEPVLQRAGAR
jgi:protein-disulfide isomerase